jgi:ankyrin repeat protein
MDYLCECNNDRDRREALKKLPPDLPSSYERILERVNRSSRENQELVKKTLHWIVYAEGYIGPEVLIQALAVRDEERHFDSNSMTTEEDILHWCSSLVRRNTTLGVLELAHFTVKEFLEAINPTQRPSFQQYRLCDDHTILAKACLNFILCQEIDGVRLFLPKIPGNRIDFDIWEDELSNNYPFFDYACEHWSGHVHKSNWDSIESSVMRLFDTKSAFEFWTLRWLQERYWEHNIDVPISKYFEKSSSPTALHWAAVFALDKLCAILIERGLSVAQQSIIGTPLYCGILSWHSILKHSKHLLDSICDHHLWMKPERQSVIRQLLDTGLDLDIGVDPEGQLKALTVALGVDGFAKDPFLVSMLLDSGARLSAEDFVVLKEEWQFFANISQCPAEARGAALCGLSVPRLIKTATGESLSLLPGAEFGFFSFMLLVVAVDWPIEDLQDFFEIRFSEMFPCCGGSDLDKIIRDDSRDPQGRLVDVLSKAVRHSAPTIEEAISSLQSSLEWAVLALSHSTGSFLFHSNDDPDASHQCSWSTGVDHPSETYLHWVARKSLKIKSGKEIIRVLILHGASVVLPSRKGITPIELAAEGCDSEIFQLFWDALVKTLAFEYSLKLIKRIVCTAIRSNNEAVLRFLTKKVCEGKFVSDNYLLEFAVGQESSEFLEFVLVEQRYGLDGGSTAGRVFEENTKEDGGDNDDEGFVKDSEDQLLNLCTGTKDDDSISRGLQALYFAAKPEGSLSKFIYLIGRGIQVSHQYQNGNTILHILAANHDDDALMKLNFLLETGPKLDILNDNRLTPLALAIRSRNIRGMEMILDARADLNVLLADNQTFLHMACYLGNKPAVEALLRCGSQTWHRNNQGQTPNGVALACEYQDIAAAIQNTIDCHLSFRENHQDTSSRELPRIALSNFAQTEEHGDLPLRVFSDADAINGSHDSTAMDLDTMAITSSPNTSSTQQITTNPTNVSETFTNNPLKRQHSSGEDPRVQVSTKRTRPR